MHSSKSALTEVMKFILIVC